MDIVNLLKSYRSNYGAIVVETWYDFLANNVSSPGPIIKRQLSIVVYWQNAFNFVCRIIDFNWHQFSINFFSFIACCCAALLPCRHPTRHIRFFVCRYIKLYVRVFVCVCATPWPYIQHPQILWFGCVSLISTIIIYLLYCWRKWPIKGNCFCPEHTEIELKFSSICRLAKYSHWSRYN